MPGQLGIYEKADKLVVLCVCVLGGGVEDRERVRERREIENETVNRSGYSPDTSSIPNLYYRQGHPLKKRRM